MLPSNTGNQMGKRSAPVVAHKPSGLGHRRPCYLKIRKHIIWKYHEDSKWMKVAESTQTLQKPQTRCMMCSLLDQWSWVPHGTGTSSLPSCLRIGKFVRLCQGQNDIVYNLIALPGSFLPFYVIIIGLQLWRSSNLLMAQPCCVVGRSTAWQSSTDDVQKQNDSNTSRNQRQTNVALESTHQSAMVEISQVYTTQEPAQVSCLGASSKKPRPQNWPESAYVVLEEIQKIMKLLRFDCSRWSLLTSDWFRSATSRVKL